MTAEFDVYCAAHLLFKWVESVPALRKRHNFDPNSLSVSDAFAKVSKQSLEEVLERLFWGAKLARRRNVLAEALIPQPVLPELPARLPGKGNVNELEKRAAFRALVHPAIVQYRNRVVSFPLCRTAIDVLAAMGANYQFRPMIPIAGCCPSYEIFLRESFDGDSHPDTIAMSAAHETGHLFYQILHPPNRIIASRERLLDQEAKAALKRDPGLVRYALRCLPQRIFKKY